MLTDTDSDNLDDGTELSNWFDPLDSNPDGDTYNDYQEYSYGMNPYKYDLTSDEWVDEFYKGVFQGDFIEDPTTPELIGQITGSVIPVAGTVADIRDIIGNSTNGHYLMAVLSGAGIIPAAGDAIKGGSKVAKFITKNIDKTDEIADLLITLTKNFPDDFAKLVPSSSLDEIAESLKNSDNFSKLSKSDYKELKNIFSANGKNLDELVDVTFKNSDKISIKFTKIASNYKNLECVECANSLQDYLKSLNMNGTRINLTAKNAYQDIIYSNSFGEAISYNGKHTAILFNGKVYDNIHPNGLSFNEWVSDFDSTGIISYVLEEF